MTKYNMLNMVKKLELGGKRVDHRGMHIARPGKTFIIADESQIEPKCLNWLVGNKKFLELCRDMSVYEADAIRRGIWSRSKGSLKENDATLYTMVKVQILSLSYGTGHEKFIDMVASYGFDTGEFFGTTCDDALLTDYGAYLERLDDMSKSKMWTSRIKGLTREELAIRANSWKAVTEWRRDNPLIVGFWNQCDALIKNAARAGAPVFFGKLPSGRAMTYHKPRLTRAKRDGFSDASVVYLENAPLPGTTPGKGDWKHTHGSKIVENLVQAVARDVFFHHAVRVWKELKIPVLWTVYDELIAEAPERGAEGLLEAVKEIMREPPPWMPGLPTGSKAFLSKKYVK